MRKEELRIGNWYQSVKWDVPVKCDLTDLFNLSANADGADDDPPIDDMFAPIPLTEEWLLKFGFVKHNILDYYFMACGEYEIRVVINSFSGGLDSDSKWFISIQTGYGSQPVTLVRMYVHQLQNLYFALTGEELQ